MVKHRFCYVFAAVLSLVCGPVFAASPSTGHLYATASYLIGADHSYHAESARLEAELSVAVQASEDHIGVGAGLVAEGHGFRQLSASERQAAALLC